VTPDHSRAQKMFEQSRRFVHAFPASFHIGAIFISHALSTRQAPTCEDRR